MGGGISGLCSGPSQMDKFNASRQIINAKKAAEETEQAIQPQI